MTFTKDELSEFVGIHPHGISSRDSIDRGLILGTILKLHAVETFISN